jgi:hypothetical protein
VRVCAGGGGQERPDAHADGSGINFEGVMTYGDVVDVDKVTTNDVTAMLQMYVNHYKVDLLFSSSLEKE